MLKPREDRVVDWSYAPTPEADRWHTEPEDLDGSAEDWRDPREDQPAVAPAAIPSPGTGAHPSPAQP